MHRTSGKREGRKASSTKEKVREKETGGAAYHARSNWGKGEGRRKKINKIKKKKENKKKEGEEKREREQTMRERKKERKRRKEGEEREKRRPRILEGAALYSTGNGSRHGARKKGREEKTKCGAVLPGNCIISSGPITEADWAGSGPAAAGDWPPSCDTNVIYG